MTEYRKYNPLPDELRRPNPKKCPKGHTMKGDPDATCKVCSKPAVGLKPVGFYDQRRKEAHAKWLREQIANTLGMKEK
jgi:hypothetical protein